MYEIEQIDYHYYWQLTDGINELTEKKGRCKFIQIVDISPSGNVDLMHRATILVKKTHSTMKITKVKKQ